MRIYDDCYQLMSEMMRDVWEMGITVVPNSYQNKIIKGDENFLTKEYQNYVYTLTSLRKEKALFFFTGDSVKDWAKREFSERIAGMEFKNPGEAWKARPEVWTQFLNNKGEFDYTYNERIRASLDEIVKELILNPDTRQAWMPIFWPGDVEYLGGKKRIPCSLGYFFSIRNGQLNMTYIQRSADLVTHLGNDIYLAWQMMDYVARYIFVKPGFLTHVIFSLHSYKKDWPALEKGLSTIKSK